MAINQLRGNPITAKEKIAFVHRLKRPSDPLIFPNPISPHHIKMKLSLL